MKAPQLLFIAGIPAAGKSNLGNWLEAQHGFIHIDDEKNHRLDELGVHDLWDSCLASMDCAPFAQQLRQLRRPVIFNWGFPGSYWPAAAALKQAGFTCWWFDADIVRARLEFQRMGKSFADFE